MWGCDYMPFLGRGNWAGGFYPGGFLYLLVSGIVILLLVYAAVRIFKAFAANNSGLLQDRGDSLAILKMRFAQGKISQDDFRKMKQILSAP